MLHVIAVLVVFFAPVAGQPARTIVTGFETDSVDSCQALLPSAGSVLEQKYPDAVAITGGCMQIPNPKESTT